ncbi:hypothetical protein OROMI_017996 [Orobanche minor]
MRLEGIVVQRKPNCKTILEPHFSSTEEISTPVVDFLDLENSSGHASGSIGTSRPNVSRPDASRQNASLSNASLPGSPTQKVMMGQVAIMELNGTMTSYLEEEINEIRDVADYLHVLIRWRILLTVLYHDIN